MSSLINGGFTACVSVKGVFHDSSFTYQAMVSNNIGVGGITSSANNLSPKTLTSYANLLRDAMIQHYSQLDVMPSGDVVRALGISRYKNMMNYYKQYGVIPNYYLNIMQRHIHHVRYIVFARIAENKISHHREESASVQGHMTDIRYVTSLNMRVHLEIYDLTLKRAVWSGSVSDTSQNENSYTVPNVSVSRHERLNRQVVQDVANYAMRDQVERHSVYPAPPSASRLLSEIFSAFLRDFPKPPNN